MSSYKWLFLLYLFCLTAYIVNNESFLMPQYVLYKLFEISLIEYEQLVSTRFIKSIYFSKIVTEFTDRDYFLTIVRICLFTEVIHCRIYQSAKSQWKWKNCLLLLLLLWKVLWLIDLYSYLHLLIIQPATLSLAFFF